MKVFVVLKKFDDEGCRDDVEVFSTREAAEEAKRKITLDHVWFMDFEEAIIVECIIK